MPGAGPGSSGAKKAHNKKGAIRAPGPSSEGVRKGVEAEVQRIRRRWLTSLQREAGLDYGRPGDLLRREIYVLGRKLCCEPGAAEAVEVLNEIRRLRNARARPKSDLFLTLLDVIVQDGLKRSEQHRYANELEYARRHRIPPELLIGFILQVGAGKHIIDLVRDDSREPWFDSARVLDWVTAP